MIISFDIETHKDIGEFTGDIRSFRPLGISCASTMRDTARPVVWHNKISEPGAMSQGQAAMLAKYLLSQFESGATITTWNGLFDFDILAEESGEFEICQYLALNHVDMMFHLFCVKGYPVGLRAAAAGAGSHKTEDMSGDQAPVLWQKTEKERRQVLDYVKQDAQATIDVYHAGAKNRRLEWVAKSGRPNTFELPGGWLTVKQCLELPEPDTSWMTNPLSRKDFVKWLNIPS